MPTAPAQRCANVANENKWTYDENRVLLGAIEQFSNGKIVWDVVGKVMKDAGFERTGKMCRHRYGRIVKGQTKPGVNRCNICGQRRKGHTCTGAPPSTWRTARLRRRKLLLRRRARLRRREPPFSSISRVEFGLPTGVALKRCKYVRPAVLAQI